MSLDSVVPGLSHMRVPMCVALVVLVTVANLRGIKESGRAFAIPTYVYVLAIIGDGRDRALVRCSPATSPLCRSTPNAPTTWPRSADHCRCSCLLRGFSSGAVALTGVEAISNGVPAFRQVRVAQRCDHPDLDGAHPRLTLPRPVDPCQPAAPVSDAPRDRELPNGASALRRVALLLGDPALDVRDPDPGGEHCLRRLPAPVVDHRQGRIPPATVRQPRRSTRVLERDRVSRGGRQPSHRRSSAGSSHH